MKNYLIYQSLRQTSYDCKIGNSPKNSFVGVVFNDTLLHLGLNPFDFTLGQLFTAFDLYKNGVYSNNYEDLKVFSVANILYPHINYNDQYFSEQMNTARNFVKDDDVFYNFQLDSPTGIIYDQTKGPQSQYRFGLTTVSSMGCGIVAFYNAMILLGRQVNFAVLILIAEIYGGLPAGGKFGLFYWGIPRLAEYYGVNTYKYRSLEELENDKDSLKGPVIMNFWKGKKVREGAHYVAINKRSDGKLLVYNNFSGSENDPYIYDTFEEVFINNKYNGSFMLAYLIYE